MGEPCARAVARPATEVDTRSYTFQMDYCALRVKIISHCLFSYLADLHIHIYRMSNCDEFVDYNI